MELHKLTTNVSNEFTNDRESGQGKCKKQMLNYMVEN